MIKVRKDNFTQSSGVTQYSCFRKPVIMMIPNVRNLVMTKRMFYQLAGKLLLLFAYGDLYVKGISQNSLLHANLMSTKVETNPTTI